VIDHHHHHHQHLDTHPPRLAIPAVQILTPDIPSEREMAQSLVARFKKKSGYFGAYLRRGFKMFPYGW